MEKMMTRTSADLEQKVLEYYDECWLSRFRHGHNPQSLAMHMGFFENGMQDNDQAKLNMNAFITRQLELPNHSSFTILDAGCGIGGTCFYIGESFPNAYLTGVNLSSKQVAFARQQLDHTGFEDRVRFLVEDFAATSLSDASFDFIYIVESLCHAQDKFAFYKEAMRLLKPGGKLLVLDYMRTDERMADHDLQLLADFQNGWAVEEYLRDPVQGLTKAGFTSIQANSLTSYVLPGIELSAKRADNKLKDQNYYAQSQVMTNHLKACTALRQLITKHIIDYTMVQCIKP